MGRVSSVSKSGHLKSNRLKPNFLGILGSKLTGLLCFQADLDR